MTQQTFITPEIKMDFRTWQQSHLKQHLELIAQDVPDYIVSMKGLSSYLNENKIIVGSSEFFSLCALLEIPTSRELVKSTL
jgi:hypothetical protein